MKINFDSDFDFILKLMVEMDGVSKEIGTPETDWVATFVAGGSAPYVAKCVSGKYVNSFAGDDNRIHVVCDASKFGRGAVACVFETDIDDENYPDGKRHLKCSFDTGIEIVATGGEDGETFTVEAVLPAAFGNMVSDFYEEQTSTDLLTALATEVTTGKAKIAAALAELGIEVSTTASFDDYAEAILSLKSEEEEETETED